ncbi:MAG: sugar phosphate isomerase/epimerase family protein, partial [Planctomycetota bacterium]
IRGAGYTHVERNTGQIRQAAGSLQAANRLKQQLADAQLQLVAAFVVHRVATPVEADRKKAVDQWRTSIEGIQNLGLKLVGTELTGDIRSPEAGETAFRKSLDELLPQIQEADFHLSLEPHPGDFFEAAAPTLRLIRDYDSKHIGYLHCTPHTFYLGESIRQVITEAGDLLTHVHIADTFKTQRVMDRFGTGVGLHLHLRP